MSRRWLVRSGWLLMVAFLVACQSMPPNQVESRPPSVPLISPQELVTRMQAGDKVVFVDVREPQEFAEGHIPGAINIPQRDLPKQREALQRADLVIPYCNMDFRGFYAVEDLRQLGVDNIALMQERGLYGWRDQGLPVAGGAGGLSDPEALASVMAIDAGGLVKDRAVNRVEPNGRIRHIRIEASNWHFEPNDLTVEAGDTLHLHLESAEGDHFFVQPDFELGVELEKGRPQEVVFVADRTGEFQFGSCEWTGTSLQVMKGRLRVKESQQ